MPGRWTFSATSRPSRSLARCTCAIEAAASYTARSVEFLQTIPILRIFDVARAKEFYLDYLGFRAQWEHRFEPGLPLYMQILRGACVLHLSEHHGDATPGATVFLRVTGLEAFHQELKTKAYRYQRPGIGIAPWNARLLELTDPFGNRLRFNEDIK
jgi:catechol 2,3-dioxygenase-like lactoylglutathione lyase family enzyme